MIRGDPYRRLMNVSYISRGHSESSLDARVSNAVVA